VRVPSRSAPLHRPELSGSLSAELWTRMRRVPCARQRCRHWLQRTRRVPIQLLGQRRRVQRSVLQCWPRVHRRRMRRASARSSARRGRRGTKPGWIRRRRQPNTAHRLSTAGARSRRSTTRPSRAALHGSDSQRLLSSGPMSTRVEPHVRSRCRLARTRGAFCQDIAAPAPISGHRRVTFVGNAPPHRRRVSDDKE
jgi:hypothetical protein